MTQFFSVGVFFPQTLRLASGDALDRDSFVQLCASDLYSELGKRFLGVSEAALNPTTLVLHEASPKKEQELVPDEKQLEYRFYFAEVAEANKWAEDLKGLLGQNYSITVNREAEQDWLTRWREHFKGVKVAPYWNIVPTWQETEPSSEHEITIRITPSTGFGTGTHPTTQLCLEQIGRVSDLAGKRVLDFGSGSGILAVAAALRGAHVTAVEIDPMALEAARTCARENSIEGSIEFYERLPEKIEKFDLIVANILSHVLIEFSAELVGRLRSPGTLVLSGLLEEHVKETSTVYFESFKSAKLACEMEPIEKATWWALRFNAFQDRSGSAI